MSDGRRRHLWLWFRYVITMTVGNLASPATLGLVAVVLSWWVTLRSRARMALVRSILRKRPFRGDFRSVVQYRVRGPAMIVVRPMRSRLSTRHLCLGGIASLLRQRLVLKHIEGQIHVCLRSYSWWWSASHLCLFDLESPLFNGLPGRSCLRIGCLFTFLLTHALTFFLAVKSTLSFHFLLCFSLPLGGKLLLTGVNYIHIVTLKVHIPAPFSLPQLPRLWRLRFESC